MLEKEVRNEQKYLKEIVLCSYNFPNLQCGKFLKCELLVFQPSEPGKQVTNTWIKF